MVDPFQQLNGDMLPLCKLSRLPHLCDCFGDRSGLIWCCSMAGRLQGGHKALVGHDQSTCGGIHGWDIIFGTKDLRTIS